jgi:excisionase family DNA binding protein
MSLEHPETPTLDDAALLTLDETCEALRISRVTLWRLIRTGHVVAFRVGSRVRVPASGVEEYLARHRIAAPDHEGVVR